MSMNENDTFEPGDSTSPHSHSSEFQELDKAMASKLNIRYREPTKEEYKEFVIGAQDGKVPTCQPRKEEYVPFPEEADQVSGDASASYGKDGTTASANAYANLMQITSYLGVGPSGFVTLDVGSTPEPHMVQKRAKRLMELGQEIDGVGIIFEGCSDELRNLCWRDPLKLDFLHDRWPRYTKRNGDLSFTCQHYVSNGIIFVRTLVHANAAPIGTMPEPLLSSISHRPDDYHIRELDFLDDDNAFNKSSSQHSYALGPNGCSVILVNHDFKRNDSGKASEEYHNAVCFISAISVNSEVREFEDLSSDEDGPYYRVKGMKLDDFTVTPSHPLEILEAYKLQLVPKEAIWRDFVISYSEFRRMDEISTDMFRKVSFSPDPNLDFIVRRNLEHILSVCSIPVPAKSEDGKVVSQQSEEAERGSNKEIAIALTCGDLSGHRLVTSASFFAFQFLLAIFVYLGKGYSNDMTHDFPQCGCNRTERLVCEVEMRRILRERIEDTCRGHLVWVDQAKRGNGCFGTHYWATGEVIPPHDPGGTLNLTMLTDTPFQVLKLADSLDIFGDMRGDISEKLHRYVRPWVRHLDQKNKRGFFVFSRTTGMPREGYQNYRLEDHVWIWSALQVVQNHHLGQELKKKRKKEKKSRQANETSSDQDTLSWDYSPAEFRRVVLRRFTTENPVSKQRMLAIARSPSENRFLLRNRDTALFHDTKTAFFNLSDDLWHATIDAQKFHKENQHATWDSPLRYALALLMASKNHQINHKSPEEMLGTAKKVLLQASSVSGILPGQLNMETKEPEIYRDESRRDFYWHASFETLYILWQVRTVLESGQISPHTNPGDASKHSTTQHGSGQEKESPMGQKSTPHNTDSNDASKHLTTLYRSRQEKESAMGNRHLEMGKSIPYNNLIDQKSIVEISDEWLYNLPNFLDFKPDIQASLKILPEILWGLEESSPLYKKDFLYMGDSNPKGNSLKGVMVDVPKKNPTAEKLTDIDILSGHEMYNRLGELRTAEKAKKRLIWSPKANADLGLLCLLASPRSEALSMALFFNRHLFREKYFADETTAAFNAWKTEFHLSSYQFVRKNDRVEDLKFLGGENGIRRAGMGFRILGDFFDRYWTCHVLEYEPKDDLQGEPKDDRGNEPKADNEENFRVRFKALFKNRIPEIELGKMEGKHWRQRKVLELILFDRMLEKIIRRYKEMLGKVDHRLGELLAYKKNAGISSSSSDVLSIANDIFSWEMDSYAYLEFRKLWPPFQYTLQIMEEDLRGTLDTIDLWKTRERDREPERPRWTRNDESKYRSAITKITAANNRKIHDLERYHSKIQSLRDSLASRLESTRNDLSFQSAENIRYFTYITAVFLPLGFGAAAMSTSEVPGGKMALNMFIAAVIVFVPTVLALAYGPKVSNEMRRMLRPTLWILLSGAQAIFGSSRRSNYCELPPKAAGGLGSAQQNALLDHTGMTAPGSGVRERIPFHKEVRGLRGMISRRGHTNCDDRELEAGTVDRRIGKTESP